MGETFSGGHHSGSGHLGAGRILAANRLVLLGTLPLFLVLAVVAYLTVQFALNERQAQAWVRRSYQVIAAIAQVRSDLQEAETGQRGYLLTHEAQFLAPYHDGRQRIAAHLADYRRLTADNPSQRSRARRLEELVRARFDALDRSLAAAAAGADLRPMLEEGKARMDALRQEVASGIAEENGLLEERNRLRRQTENLEIAFAIGAAVLTLGILAVAAAMLVRNNVSLAEAERARAGEAAILQATLDSVREGIAYFNADGLLCAFNGGFLALLDIPLAAARLGASRLTEFQERELDLPPAARIFVPPAPGQSPSESRHVERGGRELEIYRAPVKSGGFLIGAVDVTARLRAEAIARQSQKMEAIGHLTGGVAHDFNNLLQVIGANLDLAVSGAGGAVDAPRLKERLHNAIAAVARGSHLTNQLLAFARRQTLEPRSIDLGRVIRNISEMLRRTLGEGIQVETVIAGGLWNTLADPSQVENMILNLAINARDAMPGGGRLTLEAANAMLDEAYAATHAEVTPGQYVMLAVTDTGTGMTPEVMARVFEPFFTTKPEGKGTGLGLAQAYGFVKQSGGHIKIYSEPGEGTSIKIYLPRTRRVQDAIDILPAGGAPMGNGERVLVVEDDEGVRAAVVDLLDGLGYRVLKAANAGEALALLEREKADLLFTDVVMPGSIPTRDFTHRARQMQPGLKVLYTSGYTQNSIVHNGRLDGDAVLLSKPYRRDELARKLRGVLAGQPPAPAAQPAAARGKVLVVEDVALIRMTTLDMAEQIGFAVAEAGDGPEALIRLDADPGITILLTDLGLPGMNGRELVEEALKRRPDLKVVIATGYSTPEEEIPAAAGGVHFLPKPFDMAQLRRALEG